MSARQRCDVVGHREVYRNATRRTVELELELACGLRTHRQVTVHSKGFDVPRFVLCSGPHTNAQVVKQAQLNFARRDVVDHFGGSEK